MTEASTKRRKLAHANSNLERPLIDFESRSSARVSTASTFTLQTEELLKEAKVDYGKLLKDVDSQLHRLKSTIDSIPTQEPLPIAEATAKFEKKHRIVIPYPDPKPAKDAPYKLSFEKPAQCNVVGSYVSKTMAKTQGRFAVDMIVQMPASMFQDKDYLSMRYFYRRAYYIAYIAVHLRQKLGDSMEVSFELLHDNRLLPILCLKPIAIEASTTAEQNGKAKPSKPSSKYDLRIIPCSPDNLFPASKLVPAANCSRAQTAEESKAAASPFYNSTIKAEGTFVSYLRALTHAKNECSGFQEACILGRIWLQQRGFGGSISKGGFGHFEWAVIVALLLRTGGRKGQAVLSTSLSSTELFKAAIQFLSDTDFTKKTTILGTSTSATEGARETGPVLYDSNTNLNLLFKMSPWSAGLLQQHARSTTVLLADEAVPKFESIFIIKAGVHSQIFDAVFDIKSADISQPSASPDRRGAVWDFSSEVYKTLKKAFGKRAQLVHVQQPGTSTWSLAAAPPAEADKVTVGVIFEFPLMSRQMEHGPPAEEQKESAKFRQFWGEKAELRRFKDGSILECVEWFSRLPLDICEEISSYVLKRHLKLTGDEIQYYGTSLASVVTFSPADKEAFDATRRAFQTFEQDVRNLEDLPLQIRQLAPISPLVRYSSIDPPLTGFHSGSVQPIDVNMYFEVSNRWPDNLVAIQETKIELLLDIDRRLTSANDNITTYLGRENREIGSENLGHLDVVYDNGAAFRVRIHSDLEETLLERQSKNKVLDEYLREESAQVLANFRWFYTAMPLHTQTIATFCTRLHALSASIRLVKKWFSNHKLTDHFSEELIELFVLHAFLSPYPWRIPSSAATGFLRTLDFLSRWDWREEPLVVDSAEDLTMDDRAAIRQELDGWRKRDPNMHHAVMIVATSHERSGLAYTRHNPTKLVASRMTRLAKAACKLVRDQDYRLDMSSLFETSLEDYDIIFHLSSKASRGIMREAANEAGTRRSSQFKNLDSRTVTVPLPMRAHPVDVLVEELQRVYADTLIFFRGNPTADQDGGVIGAIWNPKLQRQKFRAGLPYNFSRAESDEGSDYVEVNRQAVLLEIARVGGSMIKKIEVVS